MLLCPLPCPDLDLHFVALLPLQGVDAAALAVAMTAKAAKAAEEEASAPTGQAVLAAAFKKEKLRITEDDDPQM